MALEELIHRIKEEAEKEIEEIIQRAEEEAKRIIEEEKEKGRKEAEKIEKQGKKEAERLKEKILASARRKAKAYIIQAKEEIINECFNEIANKLRKMDGKSYEKFMEKKLKEAIKEIEDGYIVSTRKEDEKIAKKLGLEVKGKTEGIGGVILKSRDGRKEMDLTFDFMLEKEREEIRIKIAEKLFGEK
ncbi:hypothetical protein B6U81_02415 [Thermoplasmatales archaeon ex4484_30]|nr:MAG: hypothetical protein FE041_01005 [Thermoplasmata archaeon]OYT61707.1 MAG: hypothetical protein B6U81_02415 [Thermoplasmatales archaeon ex4484_30]